MCRTTLTNTATILITIVMLSGCIYYPSLLPTQKLTSQELRNRELLLNKQWNAQFIDNANGTVTDTKTKLIWKKCLEGNVWNSGTNDCDGQDVQFHWQDAITHTQLLNAAGGFAGHTEWRVPTFDELETLKKIEYVSSGDHLIGELSMFPYTLTNLWTTTTYEFGFKVVRVSGVSSEVVSKKGTSASIRLVRNTTISE